MDCKIVKNADKLKPIDSIEWSFYNINIRKYNLYIIILNLIINFRF